MTDTQMTFISQTGSDEKGNYTMTWKDKNQVIVITKHNLYMTESEVCELAVAGHETNENLEQS